MTTTPEDPFAAPQATPQAPPAEPAAPAATPASPPPGVLVPGPLPASTPAPTNPGVLAPTPPPYAPPTAPAYPQASGQSFPAPAYPTYGPAPVVPRGLATAAIVLTGSFTAFGLINAALTPTTVDRLKETLADPENASFDATSTALGFLSFAIGIAAFVFLALWMSRIRQNLTSLGQKPGGPPSVEWWGWFVPLANFVLPALGMRALTRRSVGIGVLLGWWLPFCASFIVQGAATTRQFAAIDLATGELVNESALDAMVPLTATGAALVLVSWIFLVVIIRRTTSRHLTA